MSYWLSLAGAPSVAQTIRPPRTPVPEPVPGSVTSDKTFEKLLDSSVPEAERYSWSLYPRGLGLPIWAPSPVRVGSIGYFLDGEFQYLDVNICDDSDNPVFPDEKARLAIGKRRVVSRTEAHKGGVICPSLSIQTKLLPSQQYK